MTRLISFAVLIAIIIIIGLLFYRVLIGFFIPVFLACVLVVIFRPLHQWTLQKTGHRDQLAAVVTTVLIMLVLLLPIALVGTAAATQGLRLLKSNDASTVYLKLRQARTALGLELPPYHDKLREVTEEIDLIVEYSDDSPLQQAKPRLQRLGERTSQLLDELEAEVSETDSTAPARWDARFNELKELALSVGEPGEGDFAATRTAVELKSRFSDLRTDLLGGGLIALARERANPSKQDVEKMLQGVLDYFQPRLLSITEATGSFLIKLVFGCIIMIVTIFFFLYDGPAMVRSVMNLSPLDDAYEQELLLEFDRISRAVVLATLLSAIAQGLTAGIGYAVVGMNYLALLVMLTTVFAMVPFVGPPVVWIPVCLYVGIYEERILAASLLALWGVAVVGTVDNLVKAFVLHGQSQLHPLLALLSVLGGVQSLGPIGIVVGPMVVAMLQTLLSILQRELVHFDQQQLVWSSGSSITSQPGAGGGSTVASSHAPSQPSPSPGPAPTATPDQLPPEQAVATGSAETRTTDQTTDKGGRPRPEADRPTDSSTSRSTDSPSRHDSPPSSAAVQPNPRQPRSDRPTAPSDAQP